jgi:hypothetical protein
VILYSDRMMRPGLTRLITQLTLFLEIATLKRPSNAQ